MVAPRRRSAIAELDYARFGGPTSDLERDTTVNIAIGELLPPNPDRLMFIITNNGANTIYWSTRPTVSTTSGHRIGAGTTVTFSAFDDGSLVGRRIYAVSTVDGQSATITEVERAHLE